MKSRASDQLARTVAVNAITTARSSTCSTAGICSTRRCPQGASRQQLPAARHRAVIILQLLFTYAPPLQALFDNEAIPLRVWPWLFVGGLVFFLVVELEKMMIRSSASLRSAVTAVEAGA